MVSSWYLYKHRSMGPILVRNLGRSPKHSAQACLSANQPFTATNKKMFKAQGSVESNSQRQRPTHWWQTQWASPWQSPSCPSPHQAIPSKGRFCQNAGIIKRISDQRLSTWWFEAFSKNISQKISPARLSLQGVLGGAAPLPCYLAKIARTKHRHLI